MDDLERYRRRMAQRRQALGRLGVTNARCLCGEDNPLCFDHDHIYRREYDGTGWGLCVRCHRIKSAREQSEHPQVGLFPGDPFERLEHQFLGMYEYQVFITEGLLGAAELMSKLKGRGFTFED
jgi:hypothetical protein